MSFTNYVSDYFGGRLPLPRVFWLHGFLTVVALSFILPLAENAQAFYQLLSSAFLAYLLAWYFALWRTTNNYTGAAVWKYAARGMVLLPLLGIALTLALTATETKQAAPVAQPASQFDPSTARLVED